VAKPLQITKPCKELLEQLVIACSEVHNYHKIAKVTVICGDGPSIEFPPRAVLMEAQ